jgi:peptide-methionine (S)-S-oxide reductase
MEVDMTSILDGSRFSRLIAVLLLLAVLMMKTMPAAVQEGLALPAPAVDTAASQASSAVAVLAGGCFWGVQGVFQHVKGVSNAVSGYAGGAQHTATYEQTNDGTTGHAESVQITFDPRQISYGQLLHVFFSVAHDPTQRNRQGPDIGTQYRSTIFPANAEQAAVAKAYIAQLDQTHAFKKAIVTTIEMDRIFWSAIPRIRTSSTTTCRRLRISSACFRTSFARRRCWSADE